MAYNKGKKSLGEVVRPPIPGDGQHIKAGDDVKAKPKNANSRAFRGIHDFSGGGGQYPDPGQSAHHTPPIDPIKPSKK
jgi:hypothetical protein